MSTIVVDSKLRERLVALHSSADVRDEQGTLLGEFLPSSNLDEWESPGPDPSSEELVTLLSPDRKTYSPDEVMARLRGLK
jgi:hypothetical protein